MWRGEKCGSQRGIQRINAHGAHNGDALRERDADTGGDQGDLRAAIARRLSKCDPLSARRTICQDAHCINRLLGAARGDDDTAT